MPQTDEERIERIRKELVEAKRIAGVDPPRLIPRGESFRAETSGRPPGALAMELAQPELVQNLEDDAHAGFAAADDTDLAPLLRKALGDNLEPVLMRAERALQVLEERGDDGRRIAGAIAEQINLAAAAFPDSERAGELLGRLDRIRFDGVEFRDEPDTPGGTQRIP
jgi:hypothetical protein